MSPYAHQIRFFLRLCQPWLLRAKNTERLYAVGHRLTQLMASTHGPHPDFLHKRFGIAGDGGLLDIELWTQTQNSDNGHAPNTLLFIHGGGFAFGSAMQFRHYACQLAKRAGCNTVWAPNYRLSTQAPYPAALNDVLAVYRALLDTTPAHQIVLAGDSAGGNLSMALCIAARQAGLPMPLRLFLSSPWLHVVEEQSPFRPETYDAFLGGNERRARAWLNRLFGRTYVRDENPALATISPALDELHGLPPIYIQTAEHEVFSADSLLLAQRAQAANLQVVVDVWDGMFHDFALLCPRLPEAQWALHTSGSWLAKGELPTLAQAVNRFRRVSSLG